MKKQTLQGAQPNPGESYSILEIHNLGFFPWIRSYQSLFRFIRERLDELDPVIIRHDTKTTYRIPGDALRRLQVKSQEPCRPSASTAAKSPLTSILNDISTARTGRKSKA